MNKFLNSRILAIFVLGFSSGIPLLLTMSTFANWLSRVGLSSSKIGLISIVGIPYAVKFLWAFIFDFYKIPLLDRILGRRISWLFVIQCFLIVSIILLGTNDPSVNLKISMILAVLVAFFSASQDIVIDAVRIEILDKDEYAAGATMYTYGYRLSLFVSGAGALFLSEYFSWQIVYFYMSGFILFGVICGLYLSKFTVINKTIEKNYNFYESIILPLKDILCRKYSVLIMLLVIAFKLSDAFIGIMSSKFYVDSGFTNTEIASVTKIFGMIMTFIGAFTSTFIEKRMPLMKFLIIACILQALSNLFFIPIIYNPKDITYLYLAIAIDNFCGSIASVAIIVYLSSLCNINYTAAQYALLSSLSAVGRTFLAAPSGYVVEHIGWQGFFIFSVFLSLPAIFIMMFLKYKKYKYIA